MVSTNPQQPCTCTILEVFLKTTSLQQSAVRLYKEARQTSPCSSLHIVWWLLQSTEEIRRGAKKQRIREDEEEYDNKREQEARR
jgi:hypothetical protein